MFSEASVRLFTGGSGWVPPVQVLSKQVLSVKSGRSTPTPTPPPPWLGLVKYDKDRSSDRYCLVMLMRGCLVELKYCDINEAKVNTVLCVTARVRRFWGSVYLYFCLEGAGNLSQGLLK